MNVSNFVICLANYSEKRAGLPRVLGIAPPVYIRSRRQKMLAASTRCRQQDVFYVLRRADVALLLHIGIVLFELFHEGLQRCRAVGGKRQFAQHVHIGHARQRGNDIGRKAAKTNFQQIL